MVLDAFHMRQHLPQAIEAVFYINSPACRSSNHWATAAGHCETFARQAHADLLARYGLSTLELPLLRLDVHTDVGAPFELAKTTRDER